MKEKLIKLINHCEKECQDWNCDDCMYDKCTDCGSQHIADVLIANGVAITRTEECTASLNYEAEYNKLLEAHKHLCGDYAELKHDYESMETEFVRMRAQLDIVHLIFGGK